MSVTTLTANRDLNGNVVNTRYWTVTKASTVSANAGDDLYIGVTSDYVNRRSRIIFYPKSSDFSNETITKITLTVKVKRTFSSSSKTANTAIRYSSINSNTDEAYDSAAYFNDVALTAENNTYNIEITNSTILNNISSWCKNGTPFSLYFGKGTNDSTRAYGIQIFGYATNNKPTLSIEHIPSASTGMISSNPTIGSNFTVNIARASSNYTHKVIIQSNINSNIKIDSGIISGTSWSYTIPEADTYKWIANSASSQPNTKLIIETYLNNNLLGKNEYNFTLYAKANPVVSWTTASLNASSGNLTTLVSGYGKLTLNLKATPVDTASSISYFRVKINSCNVVVDKKYTATNNSVTINDLPKPYTTSNDTFSIAVYAINNRGKESAPTTLSTTCYAYALPSLSNLKIIRASDTSGKEDLMGTYIYGTSNIAISSNGGNTFKSISVSIKDSTLTPNINTSNPLKFYIAGASAEKEYTIIIKVTDQVATNTITTKIPSSNFVLHIKTGGKSIGIGSAAGENGTIKLGWKLLVNNGIEFNSYTNGALPVLLGGTGSTSADGARQQLGITPGNIGALSTTGGTISGNLIVNGALTAGSTSNAITLTGSSFTYNGRNIITLDDLNNELYYKTNSKITLTSGIFFGYVTSSTTEIRIVIPLKKRLDNITDINFSNFKCIIRDSDGYAIQANWSSAADYDYVSYITEKSINKENQSIVVQLKRDSAWKLRNNGVLSVTASNIVFTLI